MKSWRLLIEDKVSAAQGLALDEALMSSYSRNAKTSPTLRLYTYANHSALVGRYQHLEAELDTQACNELGIDFNRRPTGGGAILMGQDQLGIAVVMKAPTEFRPRELMASLSNALVASISSLGLSTVFRGKNDLEVDGKKIAGLGIYVNNTGALLFHVSLLVDLDVALMLKVLNIPIAKLGDKGISMVQERVTTLNRATNKKWDMSDVRQVIINGFANYFDVNIEKGIVTPQEAVLAQDLAQNKFLDLEWINQKRPQKDATATSLLKTPFGLVRLYLAVQGEIIKNIFFTGDFNEVPQCLVVLEKALKWKRLKRPELIELASEIFNVDSCLGVGPDDFVDAVLQAAGRAVSNELSVPIRQGSCYFPEVV